MRFIKLGLISAIVLFAIITGMASLLPSHVRISRAIDIEASAARVYPKLADIKQWGDWNEFLRSYDHKEYKGDSLLANGLTIRVDNRNDTLVEASWREATGSNFSSGYRIIPRDSLHCSLQWYFDFHLRWYPWEKFQSIVYDEQMGPLMEKSLQNLKRQAEQSR